MTIGGNENYFGDSVVNVDVEIRKMQQTQSFGISITFVNDVPAINDINSEVLEDGIVL